MEVAVPNGIHILDLDGLQALLGALARRGYTVLGPAARDGAIGFAPVRAVSDLPVGWGDEQERAHYRLRRRDDDAVFGYAAGAQSAKPVLFPADQLLWRSRLRDGAPELSAPPAPDPPPPYAVLGIRGCDLRAVQLHDLILLERTFSDAHYAARRADCFLVAVACTDPAGTCFCASMGSGPVPEEGYDLLLTELYADGPHRFVVRAGSPDGASVVAELGAPEATEADLATADQVCRTAAARMGRTLDTDGLHNLLYGQTKSAHWDDVATRCLACTNCTLVCPTCFCTSVVDVTDLTGIQAERHRVWDSCFSRDFSYIHGGSVRESVRSRYRQWLTHKLASWTDQFGQLGCVGCGRCITWCPAGIDLTAEVAALRASTPGPVTDPAVTRELT